MIECWFYFSGTTSDPYMYYQGSNCSSSVSVDFESDRGAWSTNLTGGGSVPNTPTPANGGGGGNPNPNPDPKVIEDPSIKNHKCAFGILSSLKTGKSSNTYDANSDQFTGQGNLVEKIVDFFNKSAKYDLTYTIGNLSGSNGYCNKKSNSKIHMKSQ